MNPLAILLDMTALAIASGAVGGLELSIHGDAAVDTLRSWSAARDIEVKTTTQRHNIAGHDYTVSVNIARIGDDQRVTAFGGWKRVEVAPCADAACPEADAHLAAGGAA